MGNPFFEAPILNSPYECPARHWELDDKGQPTQQIINRRRDVRYVSPIPKPRKKSGDSSAATQPRLKLEAEASSKSTAGDPTPYIREIRSQVDVWRSLPDPTQWGVTPTTARLLQHWRHHDFTNLKPFFCQIEAAETAIWLTEVAPQLGKRTRNILDRLANANPGLNRLALKLATGAGKTIVIAMLIAWQTINAAHNRESWLFTRGFLVITPGLTIKEQIRNRERTSADPARGFDKNKIFETEYFAFRLGEWRQINISCISTSRRPNKCVA